MIEKTRMLPKEAAEYIGCGYDKLMQMVRQGKVIHYRIGRRVFFRKESLDLWLDNLEKQSIQQEGAGRLKCVR